MLKIDGLTCSYCGKPVISGISFELAPHEKLCVLGANGSGKTTLLKGIAGLIKTEGRVLLQNRNMLDCKPTERAKKIALLSQFAPPVFGYTAYDAAAMGRYAHRSAQLFGSYTDEDKALIKESMEATGVWGLKDRLMSELSGGQLQRVFLARAFAQDPSVLLLDEPTNHLDLKARKTLTEILSAWATEKERVIIGVFHDLSVALSFSDSVLPIKDGAAYAKQPVKDLDASLLNELYGMDVRTYMRKTAGIWF